MLVVDAIASLLFKLNSELGLVLATAFFGRGLSASEFWVLGIACAAPSVQSRDLRNLRLVSVIALSMVPLRCLPPHSLRHFHP